MSRQRRARRSRVSNRHKALLGAVLAVIVVGYAWLTDLSTTPTTTPTTTSAPSDPSSEEVTPSDPHEAAPVEPAPIAVPAGPDGAAVVDVPPAVLLGRLTIDDSTTARPPYRRDEWRHWLDLDGDGCDARELIVRAASEVPIPPEPSCAVTTGRWTSAYDGEVFTNARDLDVDHLVPLADAHRSGGHAWSTDLRAVFANDPANLLAVSASSNRSKGDKGPDRWRPPRQEVWCDYANRWLRVKVAYRLSGTTAERDALGQMLDTCSVR
jgi:hypothetical protein